MGTPQQRYLPRTIASDRGDDTEPSVAHHERTLAQSAAHLVAVAHGRRAARAPWQGGGFNGISGSEAAETSLRPSWSWGSRQIKMYHQQTHARELTGSTS